MAKKPDVIDPGTLEGPQLARYLSNRIEIVEIGVKEAVDTLKDIGLELQAALKEDLKGIKPICEQFPGLCKKVADLSLGIEEIKPSPTTPITRAADNLAMHYRECTDPDCRRAIKARLAAVGLVPPPEPLTDTKPEDHVAAPAENKKEDKPSADLKPWDRLGISESKYNKNKSYYDDVIKNEA